MDTPSDPLTLIDETTCTKTVTAATTARTPADDAVVCKNTNANNLSFSAKPLELSEGGGGGWATASTSLPTLTSMAPTTAAATIIGSDENSKTAFVVTRLKAIRESFPLKLAALALLGIILTAGPVLLSIGFALVLVRQDRGDLVEEYNEAVRGYDPSQTPIITGTYAFNRFEYNAWKVPIGPTANPITFAATSNTDGIVPAVSAYASTEGSSIVQIRSGVVFDLEDANGVPFATNPIGRFLLGGFHGKSYQTSTRYKFGVCDKDVCDYAYMSKQCAGITLPLNETCTRGLCWECPQSAGINDMCLVVTQHPNGTCSEHPTMKSCYYPFETTSYSYKIMTTGYPRVASVRFDNDPFIIAQRLTKGTMDFGPSHAADRTLGTILVVLGAVLTVGYVAGIVGIAILSRKNNNTVIDRDMRVVVSQVKSQNAPPFVRL